MTTTYAETHTAEIEAAELAIAERRATAADYALLQAAEAALRTETRAAQARWQAERAARGATPSHPGQRITDRY